MSSVVSVKVADIRPQYGNLKEWMADKNNLYIGRRGIVLIEGKRFPDQDSKWANPYKIGKDGERKEVLIKYEAYIKDKMKKGELDITEIKGKVLGCWCKPDLCHGDILIDILKYR